MRTCIGCGRRGDFIYRYSFKVIENRDDIDPYVAENLQEDPRKNHEESSAGEIDVCPKCLKNGTLTYDISVDQRD